MCDVSFVPDWAQIWRLLPGPTKLTEMTANFEEGKYAIHVLSKVTEDNVHPLQCFAYLCKVTHDVTRIRAFLEEEKRKFCLHHVYSKTFPWKGPPSNTVKLIMESGGFKEEKEFDRNKVDGMSFGEKKVYTLPKCTGKTMTFTATVINEEGNVPLLVTEPFDIGLSRPVLMKERRPAVEHDDLMPQAAEQSRFICILLIFILHIATVRRPLF